jgi:hypothetical protein
VKITVHSDHGFWDTLNVEGTPLHFDPVAANASTYGTPTTPGAVSIEDLADVDVTGFTNKDGDALPWRSLVSDYAAPSGQMKYDPNGTSFKRVKSFASFAADAKLLNRLIHVVVDDGIDRDWAAAVFANRSRCSTWGRWSKSRYRPAVLS